MTHRVQYSVPYNQYGLTLGLGIRCPNISVEPEFNFSIPSKHLIVVVLPDPLGPMRPSNSPSEYLS